MKKSALIIFHEGVEEIEAITPTDLLRRAGVEVTTASTRMYLQVEGRSGIVLIADKLLDEVIAEDFDCLILPGGPGVKNLCEDERIITLVQRYHRGGRWIGAICAAPLILEKAGILEGHSYTSHYSTHDILTEAHLEKSVIISKPFITSPGAGTANEFSLALIHELCGPELAENISHSIEYKQGFGAVSL